MKTGRWHYSQHQNHIGTLGECSQSREFLSLPTLPLALNEKTAPRIHKSKLCSSEKHSVLFRLLLGWLRSSVHLLQYLSAFVLRQATPYTEKASPCVVAGLRPRPGPHPAAATLSGLHCTSRLQGSSCQGPSCHGYQTPAAAPLTQPRLRWHPPSRSHPCCRCPALRCLPNVATPGCRAGRRRTQHRPHWPWQQGYHSQWCQRPLPPRAPLPPWPRWHSPWRGQGLSACRP